MNSGRDARQSLLAVRWETKGLFAGFFAAYLSRSKPKNITPVYAILLYQGTCLAVTRVGSRLGWPKMAQMCRSYRDQWFSHLTYPVGEENALKPQKSKCLSPALFILRYAAF